MRKIIGGRKYDTDTATLVGSWDNRVSVTDFSYCEESLYRKRTGEYFLAGEGGPMSRYAEQSYGMWHAGEAITPLTYDEAREWAERHLDADGYEAEFGPVDEGGDEDVVLTVRVPAAVKSALEREVARTGETRGQVLARWARL